MAEQSLEDAHSAPAVDAACRAVCEAAIDFHVGMGPIRTTVKPAAHALIDAARADAEALLRGILANVRYERDEDDNWHSIYADKPLAAAATERARAALGEQRT